MDPCQITEGGQNIQKVNISRGSRIWLNPRSHGKKGNSPGVLIEVLLSLQPVSANRHSVIRSVENICIVELSHLIQFLQYAGHLKIDVLGTGQLTANFVPYGALVPVSPYSANRDLVAQSRVTMVKGMLGQPVERKLGSLRINRRQRLLVLMVQCTVFLEQIGRAIADIVWMGETEVDKERVRVICFLPSVQVINHPVAVPLASGFRCSTPFGGIFADSEQFVGRVIAVTVLAGTHSVIASTVKNCRDGIVKYVFPPSNSLFALKVLFAASW